MKKSLILFFVLNALFANCQVVSIPTEERQNGLYSEDNGVLRTNFVTISKLRTGNYKAKSVYITDAGKEGWFKLDASDTTTPDNTGTCVVSSGRRYKRVFEGGVKAIWFKLESDSEDGACIKRAVSYAMAQDVYPSIVITRGKWVVNNNAVILAPALNKKISIIGEGSPTIDFLCNSSEENEQSAVFRTPTAWSLPVSWASRNIQYGTIEISGIKFDGSRNPPNNGSNTVFSRPILLLECQYVTVHHCNFQNIPGTAIHLVICDGGDISNNNFKSVFARNTVDNIGDAITVNAYCKQFTVSNNSISLENGQVGRCGISIDYFCKQTVVSKNTIRGYERGIHIEGSTNVLVSDNVTTNSPTGILFSQTSECKAVGNIIDGLEPFSTSQLAYPGLLWALDDDKTVFEANTIKNWSGHTNSYLIKFFSTNLIFKNNNIFNASSAQLWMYGDARQNIEIFGNTFTGPIELVLSYSVKTKVISNIFKGAYLTADNTTDLEVRDNTFDLYASSTTRNGLNVYSSTRPRVLHNIFYDCGTYVIEQALTTNGLFEDNTHYINNSNLGQTFFVSTGLSDTGANQNSLRVNYIRDFKNNKSYSVGNRGVATRTAGLLTGVPPGTVVLWPSNYPPVGWMVCDGSAVSRTDYWELYGNIGTVFGVGDGSTTFNLPNFKGKTPIGRDASQIEFDGLGEIGGEKSHVITTDEMPSHTHGYADGASSGSSSWFAAGGGSYNVRTNTDITKTTLSAGLGNAMPILPPYISMNYIIKL